MKPKRRLILGLLLGLMMTFPLKLFALEATTIITDSFDDLSKVNVGKTTAEVNTAGGFVQLPANISGNALALYEDSYDITIVNGNAVETYAFNGTSWQKDDHFSVGGLTNPIGLAARNKGEFVVLDSGTGEALYYQYDGSGMTENPYLSVLGLTNPLGIGIQQDSGEILVSEKTAGGVKAQWYSFDGTGRVLNNILSVDLGDANPIAVSQSQTSFDYVVADSSGGRIICYGFDGSGMTENPFMTVTSPDLLINPQSVSLSKDGSYYAVAGGDAVQVFSFDGTKMSYNPYLSITGIGTPLSVALKPGSYEYAVLYKNDSGQVSVAYYAFDGTSMMRVDTLTLDGLAEIPFRPSAVLTGKTTHLVDSAYALTLTSVYDTPEGTSLTWEVTFDDGATWVPAELDKPITDLTGGTDIAYRCTLATTDKTVTPKIYDVTFGQISFGVLHLKITENVGPEITGNPTPPFDMPPVTNFYLWAGYNVSFEMTTIGDISAAYTNITGGGKTITLTTGSGALSLLSRSGNLSVYKGTFATDPLLPPGTHLDFVANLEKAASPGTWDQTTWTAFATVWQSALKNHPIHMTK